MKICFEESVLQAIADALGDTAKGLTGPEIGHYLNSLNMQDPAIDFAKRHRLYNAFAGDQNRRGNRTAILEFIRRALKPANFVRQPERYEPLRSNTNKALAFAGLAVNESAVIYKVEPARTLSEAQLRADRLRSDLVARNVHIDVLRFCREELVADNYFHAILEATKGVADKIRQLTGLTDDGAILVDRAFSGDLPMLVINPLETESQKSEQKGFANLIKGTFGMFRNTTAHAPKITWAVIKDDAEEVFNLLSLIHKRLDAAKLPPRI